MTKKKPPPPPGAKPRARTQRPRTQAAPEPEPEPALPEIETGPAPKAPRAFSLGDYDGIEVLTDESESVPPNLSDLPQLRIAICETHGYLASAQNAVTSCGQTLALAAAGADGAEQIINAIRREPVDAVIIALPGPGTPFDAMSVVEAALDLDPRRPILIAAVQGTALDAVARARDAGCDLVTTRPHDPERLAPVLLAAARLHVARDREADALGEVGVLRQRIEQLTRSEPGGLEPLEAFQRALETEIKRARRYEYAISLAMFAVQLAADAPGPIRGILRARIGNTIVGGIRDVDIASQLDQERFLVLLPYTSATGARQLTRRVIGEISAGPPVTMAGRTYSPQVIGAVAGAEPGDAMSFEKLVGDASAALEAARKKGVELL